MPNCAEWVDRLDSALAEQSGRVIVVAHSLGCIAFAHWVESATQPMLERLGGALLIAPADPEREDLLRSFAAFPKRRIPVPTLLVASENDSWMPLPRARSLADQWGSTFVNAGNVGHINVASGHGPWPAGKALLNDFVEKQAAPVVLGNSKRKAHAQPLKAAVGQAIAFESRAV